jgi:hypothetical protein
MKSKTKYLLPIILAILFLAFAGTSSAQSQETIVAQVDRTTLSTDEMLTLTVTINAAAMNAPAPSMPSLQGFNIVGSSTSSQISMINGAVSSRLSYLYRLQPYDTGELLIEPIQVSLKGQTFHTEPIMVYVTQGTGAPAAAQAAQPRNRPSVPPGQPAAPAAELAGQDVFIEAEVDNPRPYVGEQIVYTFRFYRAVNLWDQPEYAAPAFKGFWSEPETDQYDYRVQASGRVYQVAEVRTILFPSVVGPVTIEPARLTIPGSLFRSGKSLHTQPVVLDVQPLPPTAPEGFTGAVGQFSLTGAVDVTQSKVNEPLTWQVTLSGRGNLNATPDPIWPEMAGWRGFETEATVHSEAQDGEVVGSRVYERLLVPGVEGEATIPALTYIYFDPVAGDYQTASTEPIAVSIAPGEANPATMGVPPAPMGGEKEAVEQTATDIRHLKPVPSELSSASQPVTQSGLYWAAWAFPVFGALGYWVWQRRQRYWENNLGLARSSQARSKAKKALARARRQKQGAYSAAGQILTAYLADKLDRPVTGLTHQALAEILEARDVASDLIERVEVVLVSSDLGRFAPGADSPDHAASLLKEVDVLINVLERAL